ncbi:MAG TPA: hypothetical protein VMM60_12290 [Ilumatobacter sp.]|nr:hypothetical protein [Ilumatobacter sp.]
MTVTTTASSMIRTRWAAIGAALAVAVGAGGISFVNAAVNDGERTVFVPIVPCRLFDTRPEFQVGPRSTPLGAAETYPVVAIGPAGNCNLPADAVGVALNVTATDAAAPTFLTLWAAGEAQPTASHLNPLPGDGPTPNAVTTDLGVDGSFNVYNLQGSVHVLADVLGYYADHAHDDRYPLIDDVYTKTEVDALVADPPFLPYQPHLLAFQPNDPADWDLTTGWQHTGASDCLLLPIIDPPPETRINTIKLVYFASVGAELDVAIQSYRRTGGVGGANRIVNMVNDAVPLPSSFLVNSTIEIKHVPDEVPPMDTAGPIPGPGYDTIATFCTNDSVRIVSAELTHEGLSLGI